MSGTRVLVAGASIAGPALAHWLRRRGAEVTVVERAPGLRPGGQADVDQDRVGSHRLRAREGLGDRTRLADHRMAPASEDAHDEAPNIRVVVDDENRPSHPRMVSA